jgi:small-conductance mechanosensitive channel
MRNFLPNPYLLALGMSLLAYILIWGLKLLLSTRLSTFSVPLKNKWNDIVVLAAEKTTHFFIISCALYTGFKSIKHSLKVHHHADQIFFVIVMWQIGIWTYHLLEKWITTEFSKRTERNKAAASSIGLIQVLARLLLFSVISLFTLSNLGIKITTIIAGLGVGGIAVALALQKILGDLFSSLSIVLDKPFVVGDFIIIDHYMGEVEKIGLKTTRIRSLSGEQIIFSNSDLLAARIRNFKRMRERRVSFELNFPLQTSTQKLKSAISLISAVIRTKRNVRFERCHLMKIGITLDVETIYWVLSDDYDLHMDIQQEILYDLKNAFEEDGITFAYPTRTVQLLPAEIILKNEFDLKKNNLNTQNSAVS